jgi:hypothetical protein
MIGHEDLGRPCRVQLEEGRSWRTLFRKRYRTVFDGLVVSWEVDTERTRLTVEDGSRYVQTIFNRVVAHGDESA